EGLIRKFPTILAEFALRAYDKILRTLGGEDMITTYFGAHMYCNTSDLIQFFIFHFGVWEPDVSRVIERNLDLGVRRCGRKLRLLHIAWFTPRRPEGRGYLNRGFVQHIHDA